MAVIALLFCLQDDLPGRLRDLDAKVLSEPQPRMISRDANNRIKEANRRESEAWAAIKSKEDWERYRDQKIQKLRESLGTPEPIPKDLHVRVTRTLEGAGHKLENLVFESRPGLLVTANLYLPEPRRAPMPGIVIVHSHHNPKTQGELQDMGVLWARAGCAVLIMDQLGHGERRQHPFVDLSSFKGAFKPGRQDYWFRYNVGIELYLLGESLVGWMAWDVMRGVDLLLLQEGIDAKRMILLGSVAGGGDPAAVAAALDPRISAVVPFNFGGPQPESRYPLPDDAEANFNYAGGGSWESTRNLRLSARDGFLPWVIVGSVAPRPLVYAHEFSWDFERDPVWKRLGRIFGFYGAEGNLASAHGRGLVTGQPPEATHCNNIGPVQRQGIHSALERWYRIPPPEKELQERRPAAELACLTREITMRPLHELLRERTPRGRARNLPKPWERVLGDVTPQGDPKVDAGESGKAGEITVERLTLEVETGIAVPLVLLMPPHAKNTALPVVVAIAQGGKQEFLKKRSDEIAAILKGPVAVCLADLRGTGETSPGGGRGRAGETTSIAATELMLGRTLVGLRVRDLRSVLRYLRTRGDLDARKIGLWGESFAPVNSPDRNFAMPHDAQGLPEIADPMGALVALFAGAFEPEVLAVYVRGGLVSYRSLLDSPFVYIPFDAIIPGALTEEVLATGDLGDFERGLFFGRRVRQEGVVDGLNRRVSKEETRPATWLVESLTGR